MHRGVMDRNNVRRFVNGRVWEVPPERVKAPYMKAIVSKRDPKYHETRETLWEVGGTTPQG